MRYTKPPKSEWPVGIQGEMESTDVEEWHELVSDLVGALRKGFGRDYLVSTILDTGWSRAFASYAIDWAQDSNDLEVDVDKGETQASDLVNNDFVTFVRSIPRFAWVDHPRRRLLLQTERQTWRPWEVVALDTAFRRRIWEALESSTLDDFCSCLDRALSLLEAAGVRGGGAKARRIRYEPVFMRDGKIHWNDDPQSSREEKETKNYGGAQVAANAQGLGRFLPWYTSRVARVWLQGVTYAGPIDTVALHLLLQKGLENLSLGNSSVSVLTNLQSELEPHAQAVSVEWLSSILRVRYFGLTPVGRPPFLLAIILGGVGALVYWSAPFGPQWKELTKYLLIIVLPAPLSKLFRRFSYQWWR